MVSTVEQLRKLLAPLDADESARNFRRVSVDAAPSDPAASFDLAVPLHALIAAGGIAARPPSFPRRKASVPSSSVRGLASELDPVELPADVLLSVLVSTCRVSLAYGFLLGPWTREAARSRLGRVLKLLGPEARWWSNVAFDDPGEWRSLRRPRCYSWRPVTGHTFDHVLIGAGAGAQVTVLAFADD
ncbi:hypothetical protein DZF91_21820 [Actinomadura logoneensis]|uniref:Uncharacterized protein n=1 Tax=Actinomadura logoneensis TaxID=2293572 RepID=A0A372JHQ1_9ACTN|nr:hypothetical protein [Actinomadura logoneensis]RFU39533.1 hypothetical protein DZF91_21820 [Actinomadura logoneensis]